MTLINTAGELTYLTFMSVKIWYWSMSLESGLVLVTSPQATPPTGLGMGTPGMEVIEIIIQGRPQNIIINAVRMYLHQTVLDFLHTPLPLTTNLHRYTQYM